MFKLVLLAAVLTYASAGTVFTFPGGAPIAYAGAAPLTYAGAAPLTYAGAAPLTYAAPVAYTGGALVQPTPYRVATGVKTEVKVVPVEQHGYVIRY